MKQVIEHREPLIFTNGGTQIYLNDRDTNKDVIIFEAASVDTAYFKEGKGYLVLNRKSNAYKQEIKKPPEPTPSELKTRETLDIINRELFS